MMAKSPKDRGSWEPAAFVKLGTKWRLKLAVRRAQHGMGIPWLAGDLSTDEVGVGLKKNLPSFLPSSSARSD
jgi:hypothetical protein